MFSKAIFKQTLKANYKLWLIFTLVLCVFMSVIIAVFNPKMISSMMEMVKDSPMADMMGSKIDNMSSLLGLLSQSFYALQGVILPLIFIIMTANSLIASQVDRGSMAYLLSTPTKRSVVVRTQAAYLIVSVFMMFLLVTGVGLITVEVFHHGISGATYTEDVKSVSQELNLSEDELSNQLNLIINDPDAIKVGADARGIEEDVYTTYLNLKLTNQAYEASAKVLGLTIEEVSQNLSLIKADEKALQAASDVMGMSKEQYAMYLDGVMGQNAIPTEQATLMQNKLMEGLSAAAEVLGVEASDLSSNMGELKSNSKALEAAVTTSGLPEDLYLSVINNQLASNELVLDDGINFNIRDYIMLNVGLFLLMFATSAISFLASCIFNLSKNSLAVGAGIPLAFFIFQIMAQVDESLEGFKYLTLNTLFDTEAILNGGDYLISFAALGLVGVVLYSIAIKVFVEKDLPL